MPFARTDPKSRGVALIYTPNPYRSVYLVLRWPGTGALLCPPATWSMKTRTKSQVCDWRDVLKQMLRFAVVSIMAVGAMAVARAQQSPALESSAALPQATSTPATVPPLVPITGVLSDSAGNPLIGPASLVLAIYSAPEGGVSLWAETQTVQADQRGRYNLTLGASSPTGIPVEIFASPGPRWLGVTPVGQPELPRTPILSVAYAFKAADSDTLGGKPASAYALAQPNGDSSIDASGASSKADKTSSPVSPSAPTPGPSGGVTATQFTSTNAAGPSFVSQATSGAPLQVGSSALNLNLNADFLDGLHAAAFPQLATPNTFTANQTINGFLTATSGQFSGLVSTTSSNLGSAIRGEATNTTGVGFGVKGITAASVNLSAGVYGAATNPNAFTHGVFGESQGTGAAIRGIGRNAVSGIGVEGYTEGSSGIALFGQVPASTGNGIAVLGTVNSATGTPGVFQNNGGGNLLVGRVGGAERFRVDGAGAVFASSFRDLAGNPINSGTVTSVGSGTGLTGGPITSAGSLALDTSYTDSRYAALVHGHDVSQVTNAASLGANTFNGMQMISGGLSVSSASSEGARVSTGAASGIAVLGLGQGSNGTGVKGEGTAFGVSGASTSVGGSGLWGVHSSNGFGFGAVGLVADGAVNAVGVQGINFSDSGAGVRGVAVKAGAVAGVFDNIAGGNIIVGQVNEAQRFRVDGAGAVYASSYRDLAGNPIPTGTGDITGVAPGSGLSGGGTSGDVSLALDTSYTDARYAAIVHGHDVSQITNAARLGSNTFTGDQAINGTLTVNGAATAPWATFSGTTGADGGGVPIPLVRMVQGGSGNALFVENTQDGFGHALWARAVNFPIQVTATSGSGIGVRADATSPVGQTNGLLGVAFSTGGFGVRGDAIASSGNTKGVLGQSFSTGGVGVEGVATAASGATAGVRGIASSTAGAAGVFDNTAGGNLLVGQVNSVAKFRVDGAGAVYAGSYRDLAGNPIPTGTGDITGVAPGVGLSGGGTSGDVSLGLDTAFTDGRYAPLAHGHDVSQIAGAARLTANTFNATQTIDTGNLDVDPSTATTGNVTKNGQVFLHNFGTNNTFLGINAGNLAMTGDSNTALGGSALLNNSAGTSNTALGYFALRGNTDGGSNVAAGNNALRSNTSGAGNTAVGGNALFNNIVGGRNTAAGVNALFNNTGGSNVAVGDGAGLNATTGASNIYLGTDVSGVAGESNTMYLGKIGTQTKTLIAGVRGTSVSGAEMVVIDANGRLGSAPIAAGADTVGSAQVIDESLTASDLGPNSVGTSELAADSVTSAKVAFNYAGSLSEGGPANDVACVGCVSASEVGFTFAGLGTNTFGATQTIDAGNLDLDTSTASTGNITKNGNRFLHDYRGTFIGSSAGNFTTTGFSNVGVGAAALFNLTTGNNNTGVGDAALNHVTSGFQNTGVGLQALLNNQTGRNNVAVGVAAGSNLADGNNNIYLGSFVPGQPNESSTMYLGGSLQNKTFIAGVRGTTTVNADAIPVMIDSAGQLGTVSSSRRFKEDIRDMNDASQRLFQLRPVTFRYKGAYANGSKPIQYGLIAEEVAEVFPELAVRNAEGSIETVHYETLSVLLLNEMQSQERRLRAQADDLQRQQQRIEALERQLNELAASIPKRR